MDSTMRIALRLAVLAMRCDHAENRYVPSKTSPREAEKIHCSLEFILFLVTVLAFDILLFLFFFFSFRFGISFSFLCEPSSSRDWNVEAQQRNLICVDATEFDRDGDSRRCASFEPIIILLLWMNDLFNHYVFKCFSLTHAACVSGCKWKVRTEPTSPFARHLIFHFSLLFLDSLKRFRTRI